MADDSVLLVMFVNKPVENPAKSAAEGRPIYDDCEQIEIRIPGSKDIKFFPAHSFSHWETDPFTGGQRKVTYAERFPKQYKQFKEHATQTKSGTPLEYAPFLSEARRLELRGLAIYTVEALAHVDGQELKNLGQGGRDLKNQAEEFIANGRRMASDTQMQAEVAALRARLALVEEDNDSLKSKVRTSDDDAFGEMTDEQLQDYVVSHTGHPLLGSNNRKTLLRMALDARPKAAMA